ncbi:ead/Ea22-like family protein [Cronobacter malonaticus]|uniref:ead/Ea22-like family protein n=1 Tax=Cronobacter malonaticus TaxID=413503 RepID=UPI0029C9F11D|nr:ead/Ea22-like family protein [Cronobacter malonaticus]
MTIDTAKLKAAAEKATPGRVGDRIDGSGSIKYRCVGADGSLVLLTDHKNNEYGFVGDNGEADELFFRLCTPEAVLELIAALEAKDAQIAELLEKQRLIDICQGQGLEHRIAAERRAEAAEKRVAELERQAIQPLPIGELISRLEEQTGEPWGEVYLAGINLRRGESDHG